MRRRWRWAAAGAPVLSVVLGVVAMVAVSVGAVAEFTADDANRPAAVASGGAGCMPVVLLTMRTIESAGRYDLRPNAGGASGGYQMIDPTWRAYAQRAGVDPGVWPQAWQAPPEVQDQVVTVAVQAFLDSGHPVADVPVYWYLPAALTDEALMDVVPMPEAGNVLTPRQYQERWLAQLAKLGGCPKETAPAPEYATGGVVATNVAEPGMEQYANGCIPLSALVHVQGPVDAPTEVDPCKLMLRGYWLAPQAAASWLALRDAAAADGVTLVITSAYRSRAKQAQLVAQLGRIADGQGLAMEAGESPHGLGIAADMSVLVAKDLAWLRANAPGRCWLNAAPAREPWHWQRATTCARP